MDGIDRSVQEIDEASMAIIGQSVALWWMYICSNWASAPLVYIPDYLDWILVDICISIHAALFQYGRNNS